MVVIWGMPSCCCKGWSKLVLGCWTNSCAPRRKVLGTLLKNSGLWTLFLLLYYCILCSFITKCIIYLLFLLASLHEYINSMRTGTSFLFLTVSQHLDQCLSQKSLKKNCGIYINKCVCKWISYCNFFTVFPMLSIQLPDSVYQLNGICGVFSVYLKLIYYSVSIQAFMQNHVWCN